MRLVAVIFIAAALPAQADVVFTRTVNHTGEVQRVTADGVQIKVAIGEITIPVADIVKVEAAKPASLDAATAALKAGKYPEAVAGFKSVTDRYAGLNAAWAEEALLKLAEAHIGAKNYAEARNALDSFKAHYPNSTLTTGLDVKYARVLVEQRDTAKATEVLQGYLKPMFAKPFLTDAQESGVAEALLVLGDCQLAAGKTDDALDSYLRVVAVFDIDPDRTAEARFKAAQLFEQTGNWKRAKDSYGDLLKESPSFAQAGDARKRLDDLTKAHPE